MKRILTISLLSLSLGAFTQIKVSFSAGGNYTFIPTQTKESTSLSSSNSIGFISTTEEFSIQEKFKSKPGFEMSLEISKEVKERIMFSTGIGFGVFNFKRKINLEQPEIQNNGLSGGLFGFSFNGIVPADRLQVIENTDNYGNTQLSYISIPIMAKYSFLDGKLYAGLGLNNAFLIGSKEIVNEVQFISNFNDPATPTSSFQVVDVEDTSRDGYVSFNPTALLSIEYLFTSSFSIESSFNQGLSSIYTSDKEITGNVMLRSASLKLNYYFQ